MDPSHILLCPISHTKRRRQSHLCPICQPKRRKRGRQSSIILKGRQANYLLGRNPNNVSAMSSYLSFSFTYIFINLNTNACLFTPDDGKPLTYGLPYTHVRVSSFTHHQPATTNQRLPTLLHYLNWSFTHKFIHWHENPQNSIYNQSTFTHPPSLP